MHHLETLRTTVLTPPDPTGGAMPSTGLTQTQVARILGVTTSAVNQVEKSALLKARKACDRLGLRVEDVLGSLR